MPDGLTTKNAAEQMLDALTDSVDAFVNGSELLHAPTSPTEWVEVWHKFITLLDPKADNSSLITRFKECKLRWVRSQVSLALPKSLSESDSAAKQTEKDCLRVLGCYSDLNDIETAFDRIGTSFTVYRDRIVIPRGCALDESTHCAIGYLTKYAGYKVIS